MPAPLPLSQPCRVDVAGGTGPGSTGPGDTGVRGTGPGGTGRGGPRRYVCGEHRATGSIQGALASGTRAAREVLADA
jgi:hypothetical protein